MKRANILGGAALLVAALAPGAARAQLGGAVYAFGDSLTDNGNLPKYLGGLDYPGPPYYEHHFSNGPVFVEYLPALIGAGFTPSNDDGVGGAFAGDGNIAGLGLPGTAQEIATAAAAGVRFTAADTVILWAGSNNYFAIIGGLAPSAGIGAPAIQADIAQVSGAIASDAARLIGLGARRLVVLNVPDLGSTPGQTMAGESVISTEISQQNNAELQPDLLALARRTGANIYLVNAQLGIEEILANPAAFGLKNTTSECILVPACVNGGAAVQDTYLFWDEVHPTTGIHDYLARVIANQLLAGATIGGEAELMLAQARDFSDHLGQRMGDLRLSVPELGQVNTYVEGIYGFGDRAGGGVSRGFSYNAGTVVAGADVQVLPGLILGGAFGYGQPGARFDNGAGQLAYHAYQGGVYATGFTQLAYADVAASYSGFSAGSGERPAVLPGEAIGFAPAGHGWTLRGGTGLTLHEARLIWGPVAGLSYTHAIVGAYGESGSEIGEPLLTQSVAHQTADSLVGQAGLRAATTLRLGGLAVAPHALLAAEREFLDGTRSVETEFFSAGLPVYDRLAGYTRTYGRAGVGLAANMTRMLTGTVDFQSSFGRGNGEDRALVAKLTATF